MPIAARFLTVVLCVVASFETALAQGAATGGTKDTGSPTMVYPIRPREEPAPSTAVSTIPPSQKPVRLRRNYPYRIQRRM
jgi:hypothetical protein